MTRVTFGPSQQSMTAQTGMCPRGCFDTCCNPGSPAAAGVVRYEFARSPVGGDFAAARKQQGKAPRLSVNEHRRRGYARKKLASNA